MHQLYDAARSRVAAFRRPDKGRLMVTGGDRATFLHGLFTNDITGLIPGRGCYTAYLTPQGRMVTDFLVYELGGRMMLVLERSLAASMATRLDQLIFTEDVQVSDISEVTDSIAVVGPQAAAAAAAVVDNISDSRLAALNEHGNTACHFDGEDATVLRIGDIGEPGFEIVVPASRMVELEEAIRQQGIEFGDDQLAGTLRIEAAIPRFLVDMDHETIPLEAGIESRAISMTKGCYVGQEVIVRILHRGHGRVAEKLVLLELDGDEPAPRGAEVRADARMIGRVTSSAFSPAIHRPVALAYVHRDFVAPRTRMHIGERVAIVCDGPVVQRRASI
jgi:folate-binding protein YgfZ